jgi:predicted transcriptional regulator of viral defense system
MTTASSATHEERTIALASRHVLLRARDLTAAAIPSITLTRMTAAGKLTRVGRGLYRLPETPISEHDSLLVVARKMPDAVLCLLTALQFHGLTTQLSRQVWVAMPRGSHAPSLGYPPIRMIQVSDALLRVGVEMHKRDGVPIRVYGVTRTVVDCFKHRSKVGLDVALEALRDALAQKKTTMDKLWRMAATCKVSNVMRPYLEAAT